jgi:hypothetical protein
MTIEPRCWKKSSRSSTSTNCVEVALVPGVTAVRDSKDPDAGHLTFAPAAVSEFLNGVKSGQYDLA